MECHDEIEIRKEVKRILSDSSKKSRPTNCILCGNKLEGFCNSHSVPKLSLQYIAEDGLLLHAAELMNIRTENMKKGVNNSGTFHLICRNCDSSFFQEYENENALKEYPTDKMLAEIAVKNLLLQLSKRYQEEVFYKEHDNYKNPEYMLNIIRLDIRDLYEEVEFHKNIADNNILGGYQVLHWCILPYRVPLAMQSAIALKEDYNRGTINYINNMSEKVRMQFMHLIVLPLKNNSVVLAFYHKRDRNYRSLRHQINCMKENQILRFLNYLIFEHTENYYISPSIQSEIEKNEKLRLLAQENNGIPNLGTVSRKNNFGLGYDPVRIDDIPNFLSKEFCIG